MVNATIPKPDISATDDLDIAAAVFERLPYGVVVVRLEDENDLSSFTFIEVNPASSKHAGIDSSPIIGTMFRESFPEILQTDWPEKYL